MLPNLIKKCLFIVCVYSLSSKSTTAADAFFSVHDDLPSSYFGVLNSAGAQRRLSGDPEIAVGLRNISENVFHIYRHLTNLVFDGSDDNQLPVGIKGVKDNSKNDQNRRTNVFELIADRYKFRDSLKDVSVTQDPADPSTCVNDTGRLFIALMNKEDWAIQFFDSTGKPGPSITQLRLTFLGNYDQCRAARAPYVSDKERGFKGNYINLIAKLNGLPLQVTLGACLPDTCSDLEVTILLNQLLQKEITKKTIQYAYSSSMKGETEVTGATKAAISILSIIGLFILSGTLFDLLVIQRPKWTKSRSDLMTNTASVDMGSGHYLAISQNSTEKIDSNGEKTPLITTTRGRAANVKPANSPGVFQQVLLSFSVYSNAKKVLNTSQAPGSLGAIHGIRFLSMSWVVMCHMFAFAQPFAADGFTAFPEFFGRWTFLPISNGFVSVDTFFTLSGLLTSYLTIKEIMRRKTWNINWPMFYFHRFWRLTPPYMFALVIVLGLQQYWGQGPMWSAVQPYDKENCEDNWWTNLLYVNNLVKFDKACFGHAWYLANDMQFFVLSPLMLVPFYFHRLAGMFSCCIFLLVSWITTGALSSHKHWPTTAESLRPAPGTADSGEWMQHYYVVPWCRIGPFIVGVMAGYILACTQGKKFTIPRWVAALGWVVATGTGLAIVYGLYGDVKGDNPSSRGAAAFYNAVHRSAWGACVSWVIIACSGGYGGPVNRLLSWSPFVVLGRLTYMSYLIHISIIYTFYQNLDLLFSFNDTSMVVYYLGVLLFVNMAAFVAVLTLESPMLGLEKTFIRKERKD